MPDNGPCSVTAFHRSCHIPARAGPAQTQAAFLDASAVRTCVLLQSGGGIPLDQLRITPGRVSDQITHTASAIISSDQIG
jgi:hypothetical protein